MKPKRTLIRPTDAEEATINMAAMADVDAQPFSDAELVQAKSQIRRGRGRPLGSGAKSQVTLRVDSDVLEQFKALGAGWQTRMNDVLREWAKGH